MKHSIKRLDKYTLPVIIFAVAITLVVIVLAVLLVQKSSSLNETESKLSSTENSIQDLQSKMDEQSNNISSLSENNEELQNKLTELEDQLEESSSSANSTSYTPIPSLKSVCGEVPLPISKATQAQQDCYNNWRKKYISN